MEHKGSIICLIILGILILAVLMIGIGQTHQSPFQIFATLILLGILGFFFILILIVLIIKSI
ncbi:MAG: hypothetical protein ACFE96_14540 [Candidatus Hermodarchaeota archaeon]